MTLSRAIKVLERRIEHLKDRLDRGDYNGRDYDVAEIAALKALLKVVALKMGNGQIDQKGTSQ